MCVRVISQQCKNLLIVCISTSLQTVRDSSLCCTASSVQFFPDKAALRELRSVLVTCPNSGCLWRGNYEEYYAGHLAKCPSGPVSCPHCGQSIPKKKVQNHKRSCPNRPLTCQHCNRQVSASDMEVRFWLICCLTA